MSGGGKRSRYAMTGELRLPVLEPLTITASARYDGFRAAGREISRPTYALGVEYRPIESLLFRGKYGTAFKAPTLADQFQGLSGFYSTTTDYYDCGLLGFDPGEMSMCPARFSDLQYFGQQSGNPDLKPINAKVWSYGVVWAPTAKFSVSADYHHWDIRDEVRLQSVDQLMRDEAACRTGGLDVNSGTCQAAISQITRGFAGAVQSIEVKKIDIAKQTLRRSHGGHELARSWARSGTLGLSVRGRATWSTCCRTTRPTRSSMHSTIRTGAPTRSTRPMRR